MPVQMVAPEPPGAEATMPPSNNQMNRDWTPPGPGWGAKLNEDVIAAHPPKFVTS